MISSLRFIKTSPENLKSVGLRNNKQVTYSIIKTKQPSFSTLNQSNSICSIEQSPLQQQIYNHLPLLTIPNRSYGVAVDQKGNQVITKSELEKLLREKDQKFFMVDVREPSEVQSTGVIGSSVNIPLKNLESALKSKEEEFEGNFGVKKPKKDTPLIFYCYVGGRSEMACDIAKSNGFHLTRNYKGSAKEWFNLE